MTLLMYVHVPEREDRDRPPVLQAFWNSWPLDEPHTPAELVARGLLRPDCASRLGRHRLLRDRCEAIYNGFRVSFGVEQMSLRRTRVKTGL